MGQRRRKMMGLDKSTQRRFNRPSVPPLIKAEPACAPVDGQAAVVLSCGPFVKQRWVHVYQLHRLTAVDVPDQHPPQLRILREPCMGCSPWISTVDYL